MSLAIVIDMNLSIEWVALLRRHGMSAVHWTDVGDPRASDTTIMAWAATNGHVVLTHDLDFGTALALTHAGGPSVVQIRSLKTLPEHIGPMVMVALAQYQPELSNGALVVVEVAKSRVRILPL